MSLLGLLAAAAASPRTILPPNVNIVVDGNSISADTNLTDGLAYYLSEAFGPAANGASFQNVALGGQTWLDMAAMHSDVDAAWSPAADHNVLVVSEDSNSAFNVGQRTAAQIISDTYAYLAAIRAVHPGWKMVLWGSVPRRGGVGDIAQHNADLIAVNEYWRQNWRAANLAAWVDVRTGIPQFDHDGSQPAAFSAFQAVWSEAQDWIHPLEGSYVDNTGLRAIALKVRAALLAIDW